MILTLQQGFTYAIMIGGIVGLAIGLRKVIQLETKILKIDKNVERIVKRVEAEEHTIEEELDELNDLKNLRGNY